MAIDNEQHRMRTEISIEWNAPFSTFYANWTALQFQSWMVWCLQYIHRFLFFVNLTLFGKISILEAIALPNLGRYQSDQIPTSVSMIMFANQKFVGYNENLASKLSIGWFL